MSYVLNTYARNVKENFVKGEGVYLYTDKGDKYLDFCSGISCTNLGYQHKHLVKTMKEMADKPWHLSNLFLILTFDILESSISETVILRFP